MGYFDDEPDVIPSLYELEAENQEVAQERGTTMDIFHDLYQGTAQAVELMGRGIGSDQLQQAGTSMLQTEFAKPDASQYYNTQGRVGRVVDGIFQSLPLTAGLGVATLAGTAAAGPVGGGMALAGGLGLVGSGVYDQSLEEIKAARPELPESEQKEYAWIMAGSEVLSEGISVALPWGIGKAAGKTLGSTVLKGLVNNGTMTPAQAISNAIKGAGGKNVVAGLFGGAAADGSSEVINELVQAANKDAHGLEVEDIDLIDVFLIGAGPGGAIAGGTMVMDASAKAQVKKEIAARLGSDNLNTRMDAVTQVADGLLKVDEGLAEAFRTEATARAIAGPVDLNEALEVQKTEAAEVEEVNKIIEKPEEVLEEAGIPTSRDNLGVAEGADRVDLEDTTLDYSGTSDAILEEEPLGEQKMKLTQDSVDEFMGVSRDLFPVPEKREVQADGTEVMVPGTIAEASVPLYDAIILDNARSAAIKQGMANVLEDTNKLAEMTDLDERAQLQSKIDKTKSQIKKEVENHVAETPAPVEQSKSTSPAATAKTAEPKVKEVEKPVAAKEPAKERKPASDRVSKVQEKEAPKVAAKEEPKGPKKIASDKDGMTLDHGNGYTTVDYPNGHVGLLKDGVEVETFDTHKAAGESIPKQKAVKAPTSPTTEQKEGQVSKEAYVSPETDKPLSKLQMDNAMSLIDSGVPAEDAMVLARRGVTKPTKGTEVETVGGVTRLVDGTTIEKGTKTKGKTYKVKKDGITYRASSKKAIKEAVDSGKMDKLELWEDKVRPNMLTKEREQMGEEGQAKIDAFIEKHADPEAKAVMDKAGKRSTTRDTADVPEAEKQYNRAYHSITKGMKMEDKSGIFALALGDVAASGKPMTPGNVRARMQQLAKAEDNATDVAKLGDNEMNTAVKSADELFAKEERGAQESTDVTEDQEADNIAEDKVLNEDKIDEDADEGTADEPTAYIQSGKGKYQIKTQYYNDKGEKIPASEAKPGSMFKDETPDGRYEIRSVTDENNQVRIYLYRNGIDFGTTFDNPTEAMEMARLVDEQFLGDEDLSLADDLMDISKVPTLAVQEYHRREFNQPEELAKLMKKVEMWNKEEVAFNSKYPNGKALLEHVASLEDSPKNASLAKFLLENVDAKLLEDIDVVMGMKNSHKDGLVTLMPYAASGTQLHEVVHGITVAQLESNPAFNDKVTELRKLVKAHAIKESWLTPADAKAMEGLESSADFVAAEKGHTFGNRMTAYGTLNNKEFLAVTFGSQQFRNVLQEIKLKNPKGKMRTLWDSLLAAVGKALGLDPKQYTMLDAVLSLVPEISTLEVTGKPTLSESLEPSTIIQTIGDYELGTERLNVVWTQMKRYFAEELADTKLHVTDKMPDAYEGADGIYEWETGDVILLAQEDQELMHEVFVHEVAHSITVKRMIEDKQFRKSMLGLYQDYIAGAPQNAAGAYANTDIYEFVAEGLSNPEFQDIIKEIPSSRGGTVMGMFRRLVRGVFGKKFQGKSVLDDLMEVTFNDGKKIKASTTPYQTLKSLSNEAKTLDWEAVTASLREAKDRPKPEELMAEFEAMEKQWLDYMSDEYDWDADKGPSDAEVMRFLEEDQGYTKVQVNRFREVQAYKMLNDGRDVRMRNLLTQNKRVSWHKKKEEVSSDFPVDTDKATAAVMAGKGPKKNMKSIFSEGLTNAKKLADYIARPISDQVEKYSQKIYGDLMKFEAKLIQKQKEYSRKSEPFMRFYKELSESQQVRLDFALANSHDKKNQKIIKEMIPKGIYDGLKSVLNDLNERQDAVGLGGVSRDFYFPRRVKDVEGMMDYLTSDREEKGMIGYAFTSEEKKLGLKPGTLSDEQKAQVMTDMFQSGHFRQLPRPGASNQRSIPYVTAELKQFYDNSSDSLMGHIFEMNEKIGQREFIGGSTRKKDVLRLEKMFRDIEKMPEGRDKDLKIAEYDVLADRLEDLESDLQNRLGALVAEEMGTKSASEQKLVTDLLNARLRQKGAHGVMDAARNIGYITTMGNFLSALTQLGDIPITFYANGLNADSMASVGEAFKNVYKIARGQEVDAFVNEADFNNQLREFSQGKVTAEWVEKAFKYSGLKYTDLIGKEAFMSANMKKWQRPGSKDEFYEKYKPFFGEDIDNVYKEMLSGKKTADVMAVLITELGKFQPVTLSQQSQGYLGAGNMRLAYMLKTFTLRATSAAFREGAKEMEAGNYTKGAAKIASILMIYAAAGAGTDELKDLIRGKESSFTDNTMDNLLNMFFTSKYTIEKGAQSDSLMKTFLANLLPPVRYMDTFGADVYAAMSEDKEQKWKTTTLLPLIGTIAYGRSAAGQSGYASMEKQELLDEVKKNKKDRKGAYAGGLSKKIREYNKGKAKDERITADSVSRAYKGN